MQLDCSDRRTDGRKPWFTRLTFALLVSATACTLLHVVVTQRPPHDVSMHNVGVQRTNVVKVAPKRPAVLGVRGGQRVFEAFRRRRHLDGVPQTALPRSTACASTPGAYPLIRNWGFHAQPPIAVCVFVVGFAIGLGLNRRLSTRQIAAAGITGEVFHGRHDENGYHTVRNNEVSLSLPRLARLPS